MALKLNRSATRIQRVLRINSLVWRIYWERTIWGERGTFCPASPCWNELKRITLIFQHVLNFAKVLSFDEGGRNYVWPTYIFQKRGPTGRKSKNEYETFNLLRERVSPFFSDCTPRTNLTFVKWKRILSPWLYLKCNFFQEYFPKICKTLSDKLRTTISQ